jgi:hypothetical protein
MLVNLGRNFEPKELAVKGFRNRYRNQVVIDSTIAVDAVA